ncbi:unnamed protein product [Rotaria sp. Silwood1]|nr:unnamed protein product [Rotaria sp. Silwood1]CAF4626647.1 unnamed protein product [Rotaria sp. Silwood1]
MQVASRTRRRYVSPTMKGTSRRTPPTNIKPSNVPSISQSSPKKIVDISTKTNFNEALTLKNFVDRFHHDELQMQPEHDTIISEFSWLNDESKNTSYLDENFPESIEVFSSTDIDQDLNKRASLLLNQTLSAHSSDTGHTSNTDIDSTRIIVMHEQPTRPVNTRIVDSKVEYKIENGEDDILYQWRLRRRLEQATNNEPISFSSKVFNQPNISQFRSVIPSKPIEVQTMTSSPIVLPSIANHETIMTQVPIRQYSETSTQTIQDACIQTSLTLSTIPNISNENDLPTHDDDDQHLSVCHRPPIRSKCEMTQISSSPLSIKRHHRSFRPVVLVEHPTIMNNSLNTVQSSQESTLTQVTSIIINENNNNNNHYHQIENNNTIEINELKDDEEFDDDILNMLKQKRNELLIQFQDIELCLANIIS